jgi:hypothetical protein
MTTAYFGEKLSIWMRLEKTGCKFLILAGPERFELPTFWFVGRRPGRPMRLIILPESALSVSKTLRSFGPQGVVLP